MRKFFQLVLAGLSRRIIKKRRPKIIAITGSVGKTSTKEAVFLVVSQKFKARKSEKNFNTEFGVPFTIIGVGDPGRNIFKWLWILLKAVGLILLPLGYPEFLVLELGVEFPGDMTTLMGIVHPNVGIITSIGISHYEFFKDQAAIAAEKAKLAEVLEANDTLSLNADDPGALSVKGKTAAKVMTYGVGPEAEVKATDIVDQLGEAKYRTSLTVSRGNEVVKVSFSAIGKPHVQAIICGVAAGFILGVEKDLIELGLAGYKPAQGRLNIFAGFKHSTIIDDTYNAAPDSMRVALELLGRLTAKIKIAVLGDMLELGSISDEEHKKVGEFAGGLGLDRLITIGGQGRIIAAAAIAAGMPQDCVSSFDSPDEAMESVKSYIDPEVLILLKGSQGMRLEKITKEIMAEPMRASELLPRQYGKWLESKPS